MQVRDVMTEATITESAADTLRAAAERMWRNQTGSLLVVDDDRLTGIITERDVLRAVALGVDLGAATVNEAMTVEVFTVPPDMSLREAAREMAARWIRHLPVVEDGRLARRGQHARRHWGLRSVRARRRQRGARVRSAGAGAAARLHRARRPRLRQSITGARTAA